MSMRLSNYGPNVKQCQHPSKKRPKKLVTSLTCQVFFSVPPSHISHIFYYFQSSISRITDVQRSPIGKIGQTKFGVFLAEPFSALSFPCPRLPLFCCFFHKILCFLDQTKKYFGKQPSCVRSRCYILSEISRWTDHGKYELFPASTKGLSVCQGM